jgi:hypothetical protein
MPTSHRHTSRLTPRPQVSMGPPARSATSNNHSKGQNEPFNVEDGRLLPAPEGQQRLLRQRQENATLLLLTVFPLTFESTHNPQLRHSYIHHRKPVLSVVPNLLNLACFTSVIVKLFSVGFQCFWPSRYKEVQAGIRVRRSELNLYDNIVRLNKDRTLW